MDKNPKRERFFKTATLLLSEQGYKAMTIRELAQRLDCDKSNIYNYISSKQDLLDQLLFEIADKFHIGMKEIENSSYSPIEKIKEVIRLHVKMTFENPHKLHIHVNEWRFLSDDRKKVFVKRKKAYEKKIIEIIEAGIQEGSFKPGNKEFLKNCILSSIRWLYTWKVSEKDQNPIEVQKNITEFILDGIRS